MKKYLLTSAAALAFCGLFTSCTHDFDNDGGSAAQNSVMKTYEQAFITAFGQPDPNNEWGFGTSTVAGTRGGTRAVPGITFPTFKDGDCPNMPTKYFNTIDDAIAAGAHYARDYQNYNNGDIVYINTNYQELSNQAEGREMTVYVDGEVTYLGKTNQNGKGFTFCVTEGSTLKLGQVCERLTVYLAPNATLDITEGMEPDWSAGVYPAPAKKTGNNTFTFTKDNAALYMSAGSKVKGTNIYFKDGYTVVNEGDSIKADELHVENGAILYNKQNSVVKTTGVIALRNTKGEIDNFGTMEGASMTLDANARFYNVAGGTVTISGLTKINNDSGNNAWQNSGQFNTGSFEITGGCQDPAAFNNCHMSVTGKFFMNHGNFVLDGGAAVECGSFEWKDDNYFHMGGKALLKVTGQLLANNDDTGYGFYGDARDYAVIKAGSIEKGSEGKFRAAYFGNLFIDTKNHFEQGRSSADGTWYYFDDTVKFSFDDNSTSTDKKATKATNFSITIPKDNDKGCTPGYKYGDDDDPNAIVIRVICEDLTVNDPKNDFDFNDAVFDVKLIENDKKVEITLLAAGGTLPLYIGDDDEKHEIHYAFEQANSKGITTGTMLTTRAPRKTPHKYNLINCEPRKLEFDLKKEWLTGWSGGDAEAKVKTVAKNIPVLVRKLVNQEYTLVELQCEKGKATAKVGIKLDRNRKDFMWCDERVNINDTFTYEDAQGNYYPGFTFYVRGFLSEDEWDQYNGVVTDDMKRRYLGQQQ